MIMSPRSENLQARIDRLSLGNPGDVRPVGSSVSELRIDYGPGYRVYFVQRGEDLIVLLAGGKKDTQARDIAQAIMLASEICGEPGAMRTPVPAQGGQQSGDCGQQVMAA